MGEYACRVEESGRRPMYILYLGMVMNSVIYHLTFHSFIHSFIFVSLEHLQGRGHRGHSTLPASAVV
eukprot:COSAG02_NODE_34114_length_489_cov_0.917949_2_plen_66_part_01